MLFSMLFCACVVRQTILVHIMLHCTVSPKVPHGMEVVGEGGILWCPNSLVVIDRFA